MTSDGYHESAAEKLRLVRDEIAAGREGLPGALRGVLKLIAVSKTFEAAAVRPVIAAGQRVFGENRVQEAQRKWPALRAEFAGLKLHLIGPLQSNKAKEAVALFDAIHTIDRPKIARAIAAEMATQNRKLQLFVEVNTGEEPQKAGVLPREAKAFVDFVPQRIEARNRRPDVYPTSRRGTGRAFRVSGKARTGDGTQ